MGTTFGSREAVDVVAWAAFKVPKGKSADPKPAAPAVLRKSLLE